MLNRVEEELPSVPVFDFELQEIMENEVRSMENLIKQGTLPMCKLQGLDKQLRSIRDLLKVEVAKRLSYSNTSSEKSVSLKKSKTIQNSMMASGKTSITESKDRMTT